jgi:hypothetical protein
VVLCSACNTRALFPEGQELVDALRGGGALALAAGSQALLLAACDVGDCDVILKLLQRMLVDGVPFTAVCVTSLWRAGLPAA